MLTLFIILLLWKIRIQFLNTLPSACVITTSLSLLLIYTHIHTHTQLSLILPTLLHKNFSDYIILAPGEGHGNPLQYSCVENPMDRGAWQITVHRIAESGTTETSQHACTHIHCSHVNHMGSNSPFPLFYTFLFFMTLVFVSNFCLLNLLPAHHYFFLDSPIEM